MRSSERWAASSRVLMRPDRPPAQGRRSTVMTMRWEASPAAHRCHPSPQGLDQPVPRFGIRLFRLHYLNSCIDGSLPEARFSRCWSVRSESEEGLSYRSTASDKGCKGLIPAQLHLGTRSREMLEAVRLGDCSAASLSSDKHGPGLDRGYKIWAWTQIERLGPADCDATLCRWSAGLCGLVSASGLQPQHC